MVKNEIKLVELEDEVDVAVGKVAVVIITRFDIDAEKHCSRGENDPRGGDQHG